MGFRETLTTGECGIRFALPESAEIEAEAPTGIRFVDPERTVSWFIGQSRQVLDVCVEHESILLQEIEEYARADFDSFHAGQSQNPDIPPRTADTTWSPVIESRYMRLGDVSAVLILRRLAYEPGLEIVVGQVLIPLASGMCEITVHQGTSSTGYRESVLMMAAQREHPDEHPEALLKQMRQANYDNPRHDVHFAEHPLSLVRAAIAWMLDPDGADLHVTTPATPVDEGEIDLDNVGCAVTPWPRYLLAPEIMRMMSPTIAVFSCVVLPDFGVDRGPAMMDVWRHPDMRLSGGDRGEQLKRLAEQTLQEWRAEGATDLEIDVRALSDENGRSQVASYVRFRTASGPTQSAARWFADADGTVFRISAGGPLFLSRDRLFERVDAVAASFRRLNPPESRSDGNSPRPWWKRW